MEFDRSFMSATSALAATVMPYTLVALGFAEPDLALGLHGKMNRLASGGGLAKR